MKKKGAKKKAKEDALIDEMLKRAEPKIDKIAGELTEQLEAKFATLKILLEDHPDKRVSLLLNSISDDLGKACTTALKDVETIKEERTIAHAATSEISNLRDHISQTGREPLTLTSEIDRMQNQLNLMEGGGGGGVERLVYLVFHTIIVRGWKKFHLDVWTDSSVYNTRSAWAIIDDGNNCTGESLSVSISEFAFLGDYEGRDQFRSAMQERKITVSAFDAPRLNWKNFGWTGLLGHFLIVR